jgi:hypothetical protein
LMSVNYRWPCWTNCCCAVLWWQFAFLQKFEVNTPHMEWIMLPCKRFRCVEIKTWNLPNLGRETFTMGKHLLWPMAFSSTMFKVTGALVILLNANIL